RCGVPKLNYRLRCTPPSCIAAHATAMDETVLTTTAALLDLIKQQGQQPEVVAQLQAPLRCGGYRPPSAAAASPIAYYSSVVSCLSMPHISQAAQSWSSTASALASSSAQPCMLQQHLDQCLTTIRANITGDDGKLIRTDLVPSSASEIIPHYQQHQKVKPFIQQEVTTIINKRQLQAAIAKAEAEEDETTLARLLGVTAPGASVWLTTAPTTPAQSLTNTEYQICSKVRLGLPPLPLPSDCASCNSQDACASDPLHPLVCGGQKGRTITARHHMTVDPLYVSTLHAGRLAIQDHTRPDLQLVLNGRQVLVDVTIRHPGCKTNILHGSARQQLAAAHKGEAEKKAKYAAMAKAQQASFIPFAVETYGELGKSARKLINQIVATAEDQQQLLSREEIRKELNEAC